MRDEAPPDEIHARLATYRQFLSAEDAARLEAALARPRTPAIRINTLKTTVERARATWPVWYGWQVEPVPFCPAGWWVADQGAHPIGDTLEFQMGDYYIQDAASMLPAELFSDADAPLILDLAAAPGGKTTHLASRYGDRGVILANDSSARRIAALRSNLQTWGVFGALVTNFPGERIGAWFPEAFDRVLVDAPCSGDTLRVSTGRKQRVVSERERAALCQRQDALLTSALRVARVGGEIVYSTCTMAPEEDEGVLDGLLRAFPGAVEIEGAERVAIHAPGLTSDGSRTFEPGVALALRLWPHLYGTSGFFAARLRKTAPTPGPHEPPPFRRWEQSGLTPLAERDAARIMADLRDDFGFDFAPIAAARGLTLWAREKAVYALPEQLVGAFRDVPHAAAGLLIGQWAGDAFLPAHELVSRFWDLFTDARARLPDDRVAAWRAGRDLRALPATPYPPGTLILFEDARGRFVGRGRLQRDRVRNLLPRRATS